MRTSTFLPTFLLLFAVLIPSLADQLDVQFVRGRAYYKYKETSPFIIEPGKISFSNSLTIMTFVDGQCFLSNSTNSQFRLKENSLIFFETSESCQVRKGLVGVSVKNDRLLKIKTPHLAMEAQNAIFVIKCYSVLTRLCVLKGSVILINPRFNQRAMIKAGKEIAAGSGMYSKFYDFTDELRYAWYWVEPLKEPSLKPK